MNWGDYFNVQWNIAIILFACLTCYFNFKKLSLSLAAALNYTIIHGTIDFLTVFGDSSHGLVLTLVVAQNLVILLLCNFLFYVELNPKVFGYICMLNATITPFVLFFRQDHFAAGIMFNQSMNAMVLCMTLPFMDMAGGGPLFYMLTVLLILTSQSAGAILSLFVMLAMWIRKPLFLLVGIPTLFIPGILHGGGRLEIWKLHMSYWLEHNILWGSGLGTFYVLGPLTQKLSGHMDKIWLWMHSDILQTLYELGPIALILWGICIFDAFKKADPLYRMGLVSWLICSSIFYPVHFPVSLAIGVFLLGGVFWKESKFLQTL